MTLRESRANLYPMLSLRLFFILTVLLGNAFAQELQKSFSEGYLGEKNLTHYSGPWNPVFHHDAYFGRMTWDDDQFYNQLIYNSIWKDAPEWSDYFSQEVIGASTCPHDVLSKNFDDIRYGYRLVAMSYLLESLDAARSEMLLLRQDKSCHFELPELLGQCRPVSEDMKNFINNLTRQTPFVLPTIGKAHNFSQYTREWVQSIGGKVTNLSAARVGAQALQLSESVQGISPEKAVKLLVQSCQEDRQLFLSLCSEIDQLYGISQSPLATYLLATSNLITILNQEGMAQGCLRRFGQLMASKERHYPAMVRMQPLISASLKRQFADRFPHGRAFVYGALKEFRQKGLVKVFEDKVPVQEEKPTAMVVAAPTKMAPKVETIAPVAVVKAAPVVVQKKPEVEVDNRTAFLQAAEVRKLQDLDRAEVDMLKFKYDHVFSAAELQLLDGTLKEYTTRSALEEMRSWDKLGTSEAPLPLTFLKFLIDSQNHQGLYNVVGVLGDQFWVSNDIDKNSGAEYVELKSDSTTNYSWSISIVRKP